MAPSDPTLVVSGSDAAAACPSAVDGDNVGALLPLLPVLLWAGAWVGGLVLAAHWLWTLWRTYCWRHRLPRPSPPLPFFLGHAVHILLNTGLDVSRLHHGFHRMLRGFEYPKIGRFYLGPREIVAITDPEAFRRMLGSKFKQFDRSDVEFDIAFVRGGLITARNGPRWRRDRRMLGNHFDHASLADHMRTVLDRAQAAATVVAAEMGRNEGAGGLGAPDSALAGGGAARAGTLVDLKVLFFRMTFDVITFITFGKHFRSLERGQSLRAPDPPMLAAFEKCLNTANRRFYFFWCPYWRVPGIAHLVPGIREYDAAERCILDAISSQIRATDASLEAEEEVAEAAQAAAQAAAQPQLRQRQVRNGSTSGDGAAGAEEEEGVCSEQAERRKAARASTLEYIQRKRRAKELDMTDEELQRHLVTFLFAGHDTTANMLCFLFLYLARNPAWQRRVVDEICDQVPPGFLGDSSSSSPPPAGAGEEGGGTTAAAGSTQPPTGAAAGAAAEAGAAAPPPTTTASNVTILRMLGRLPVLEACLLETLRLKPSAPLRSRQTTADVEVAGHFVPKGTLVGWSPYVLHRLPHLFPDPLRWDPTRFLGTAGDGSPKARHHPFAFLPFGAGPRRCLGERLALLEGKLAAVVLLQRFEFEDVRPGGLDLEEDAMGLTMFPAHGMPLAVRHRQVPL